MSDDPGPDVFGPALQTARALARGRWLLLLGITAVGGLLTSVTGALTSPVSGIETPLLEKIGAWLATSLVDSAVVVALLVALRRQAWPGSRAACLITWWLSVFLIIAAVNAPWAFNDVTVALETPGQTVVTPSKPAEPGAAWPFLALLLLQAALLLATPMAPAAVILDNRGPLRAVVSSARYLSRGWLSLILMSLAALAWMVAMMAVPPLIALSVGPLVGIEVGVWARAAAEAGSTLLTTVFCAGLYLRIRFLSGVGAYDPADVFD